MKLKLPKPPIIFLATSIILLTGVSIYLNSPTKRKLDFNTTLTTEQKTISDASTIGEQISQYYPSAVGNKWVYEGTMTEQGENGVHTTKISKTLEISALEYTEQGNLMVQYKDSDEKALVGYNFLDFEPEDESKDKFILSFPLYVGQKWGEDGSLRYRDDGFYVWEVEQKLSKEILGKEYDECFKISYKTNPDTSYNIFCYGIGIVEEGYKHNGTVLEWDYKLTSFDIGQ